MNSNSDFQVQMEQRVRKIEAMLMEYLPRQRGYQSVIMEVTASLPEGKGSGRC